MKLTNLKIIEGDKGSVIQYIKRSDAFCKGIAEVYFSTVNAGMTKGWKKHSSVTLNISVVKGIIDFEVKEKLDYKSEIYRLSESNPSLLLIPPGYWVAFTAVDGEAKLINVIDEIHNPDESEDAPYGG